MTYHDSVMFAVRQLCKAVKVMKNGEEIEATNHLANAAQQFIGAAELARDPYNTAMTCLLVTLGIVLDNCAHDSTSWHIIHQLHARLLREAEGSAPDLPF